MTWLTIGDVIEVGLWIGGALFGILMQHLRCVCEQASEKQKGASINGACAHRLLYRPLPFAIEKEVCVWVCVCV